MLRFRNHLFLLRVRKKNIIVVVVVVKKQKKKSMKKRNKIETNSKRIFSNFEHERNRKKLKKTFKARSFVDVIVKIEKKKIIQIMKRNRLIRLKRQQQFDLKMKQQDQQHVKNVNQHEQRMFLLRLQFETAKNNNVRQSRRIFTISNEFSSIAFSKH